MDNSHETVDFEEGETIEPSLINNSDIKSDPIPNNSKISTSVTKSDGISIKKPRNSSTDGRENRSSRTGSTRPLSHPSSPRRTGFLSSPTKRVSANVQTVKVDIPGLCMRDIALPVEKDHLPQTFTFLNSCFGNTSFRGFIARCNYYDIFVKAKRTSVWRAPEYVIERIHRAHAANKGSVLLFFTVHQSKYFQGIAQISRNASIERPSATDKLYRVPLTWIYICDIPFYSIPHVQGLLERDDTVRESFELPVDSLDKLLVHFENTVRSIYAEKVL